jgi:heme A synthase
MIVRFMVIGTAIMAWKFYRHVPFVWKLALLAVPMVGIQGLLGAITVWRELPPEIVATHLVFAMLVLACELAVAWGMFLEDPSRKRLTAIRSGAGKPALAAIVWLAAVMWVGGYMAESGASTACTGWPTCNGSVLPGADDQEITHMIHRYIAGLFLLVMIPFIVAAWRKRERHPWTGYAAVIGGGLYALQVLVGALNVWYTFPDPLTVSHTVIASLIWVTLASVIIVDYYRPAARSAEHQLSGREVPA